MKILDGYTLMHEHVTIDLSKLKNEDAKLDAFDLTVEEFKDLYNFGVRNIVDVTNIGMGRDVAYIKRIEDETGINIIMSTGFYKEPFYPEFVYSSSIDELTKIMVDEINNGIDNSDKKPMIIGEIGTSKDKATDEEMKVFEACANAQLITGLPISTHTSLGTLGKEQVEFLFGKGIKPEKIVIGHMDLSEDINLILDLLESGVYVAFDTVGKVSYSPDEFRIKALKRIKAEDRLDQIFLSLDITRKSHLKRNGGIGYSYLFEKFIPEMLDNGFSKDDVDLILKENPKRIFSN